jgi:hypothetical protein
VTEGAWDRRSGNRRVRVSFLLSLLLVAVPAAAFLASAPRFGGHDSYYFFLYADDLASSASDTSFARYFYFPGCYAFWRVVAMAAGRHYGAYQVTYALVGLANAALTAVVLRAAGSAAILAALGFCGYLAFGQRLELGFMTTEPLATLAALLGVGLWMACRRRGRERLGLVLLGAGYGFAVFSKQQGAFLAVGAAGLTPFLWERSRSWGRFLGDAATIVGTAITVFSLGMALDGGGIAAVEFGVKSAVDYESHGRLLANLVELALKAPLLFAALAGAVCLWPVAYVLRKRAEPAEAPLTLAVWGLGAVTATATLLQMTKRSQAHYALLTLPFAWMAIVPAAAWVLDGVGARFAAARSAAPAPRRVERLRVLAVLVAVSLMGAEAWALPRPLGPEVLGHERDAALCDGIQPGQRLLLLPSRENALHWACGTHARGTRWGYTFNGQERPDEYAEELAKPELTQVFVFNADQAHAYERAVFGKHDWSSFFTALAREGFRRVAEGDAGTLYRREERR